VKWQAWSVVHSSVHTTGRMGAVKQAVTQECLEIIRRPSGPLVPYTGDTWDRAASSRAKNPASSGRGFTAATRSSRMTTSSKRSLASRLRCAGCATCHARETSASSSTRPCRRVIATGSRCAAHGSCRRGSSAGQRCAGVYRAWAGVTGLDRCGHPRWLQHHGPAQDSACGDGFSVSSLQVPLAG
jgi:hypothetical protein